MRPLSTADLLAVWDLAANQPPARRTLALLAACSDQSAQEGVVELSIGQGDERLLALREQIFGPRLASISSCPACNETLEFEVNTSDLRLSSDPKSVASIEMEYADYRLRFRLPNVLDIANLEPAAGVEINRQRLLSCCLLSARRDDINISAGDLPPDVVIAIADRMAQADPQADVQFALTCPQCGHEWSASFDIGSFVWSELNAHAIRLLNDVHVLASAYGWNEAEILSMSPARRQAYVELATR
jgi:hypothetical protein